MLLKRKYSHRHPFSQIKRLRFTFTHGNWQSYFFLCWPARITSHSTFWKILRVEADENCVVLGHYAAISNNSLPTFRNNLLVQFSRFNNAESWSLNVGKTLTETSVITITFCVTAQKNAVLICFAAEGHRSRTETVNYMSDKGQTADNWLANSMILL
jgi:hypothetical protein